MERKMRMELEMVGEHREAHNEHCSPASKSFHLSQQTHFERFSEGVNIKVSFGGYRRKASRRNFMARSTLLCTSDQVISG